MSLSLHDLEKGRRIAALVVRHCGEKYFPLFDRFDREVRERASAADRIEDAIGANMPARPRKRGRS
ncbi:MULTISPECIES: hypothetical protein [Alphaproteobacteria]|jgi:hypothetical protein|uniref:Uncharacterized protein n=1 Tax=Hyphomonas atlantica TaxID=1280948 RepID=A0A059E6T0_9PROT|nr:MULTISPECIES: hypothetical protein [Hyphomonas]MAN90277.1 hypothetical protein [Hyphomonadaceae bacterium]MBR9807861.1 hypothetical protein [Alphaproteobacteria bacterium]KCZ63649.1 hypothetical protein HY36_14250 [Hyphomonas atlantica]MAL46465.1 hypothetical protein [Hyphomonas sp.]MBG66730.1 hypothetical protein [Hyphomonas sp.]|tara:strand:- start:7460 stop:7657 length:198 start_codon:yes stop_codon:yes gene_type:complete